MGILILGIAIIYLLVSIIVVLVVTWCARKYGLRARRWGWGTALVMWLIPFWDWLPTVAVHQYYCATESGFWVYKTLDQWKAENPEVMETLAVNHLPSDEYLVKSTPQWRQYYMPDKTYLRTWYDAKEEQWKAENHGVVETLNQLPPDEYLADSRTENKQYVMPDGTIINAHYDWEGKVAYVDFKKTGGSFGSRLNEIFSTETHMRKPIHGIKTTIFDEILIDRKTGDVLAKETQVGTGGGATGFGVGDEYKFWLSFQRCAPENGIYSIEREIINMKGNK